MVFRGFFRRKMKSRGLIDREKGAQDSLYDCIVKNIQENGELSEKFSLPKPITSPNIISMADGALDGIRVYHMAGGEVHINGLTEVLKLVSQGESVKGEAQLMTFFAAEEAPLMLSCIDDLVQWVIENQRQLDTKALYEFSAQLIVKSSDKESIKFALSVLELLYETVEKDDSLRKVILELALSDEFSLFAIFIVREFEKGNQEVIEITKKVHGWGRIHGIDFIDADSQEIQNWLLMEGFKNNILFDYSARPCIEKGQLLKRLERQNIDVNQAVAIHQLIGGALSDGPVEGLIHYDQGENILTHYLEWAGTVTPSVELIATLLRIKETACEWPHGDSYVRKVEKLIQQPSSKEAVKVAVSYGHGFEVAQKLNIECDSEMMKAIREEFDTNYYLGRYLFQKELFVDELVQIFEAEIPLAKIATGPSDSLGFGPDYQQYQQLDYVLGHLAPYSGKGEGLVQAALKSSVTHNRQTALDLIDEWSRSGEPLSANILAGIETLKKTEVVEEIQSRLKKL
ncbi:hypothetical protein [uncultured Vagococcus sp.]|uniref:hypothetical protein n=1 Tax=uncultured Vagococcus sp. TaxID=189676 RepID=UPI0028D71633|nr:hypothetical protein [uncultured Vagococcus sp.]